jgi:hypothetical protein
MMSMDDVTKIFRIFSMTRRPPNSLSGFGVKKRRKNTRDLTLKYI